MMTPTDFEGSNMKFRAPEGMTESQCSSIPGMVAEIRGGDLDGSQVVVVAWKPDAEDLKRLNDGGKIYLATFGSLPPHSLMTELDPAFHRI